MFPWVSVIPEISPDVEEELPEITTIEFPATVLFEKATTVEARFEVPVFVWTSSSSMMESWHFNYQIRIL